MRQKTGEALENLSTGAFSPLFDRLYARGLTRDDFLESVNGFATAIHRRNRLLGHSTIITINPIRIYCSAAANQGGA